MRSVDALSAVSSTHGAGFRVSLEQGIPEESARVVVDTSGHPCMVLLGSGVTLPLPSDWERTAADGYASGLIGPPEYLQAATESRFTIIHTSVWSSCSSVKVCCVLCVISRAKRV